MKRTSIVLSVLVAALMLFVVTMVGVAQAQVCTPCGSEAGECFRCNNLYQVAIERDANGNFPWIPGDGYSYYIYKITRIGAKNTVSHIDIEIPICSPDFDQPTGYCSTSPLSAVPPTINLCPSNVFYAPPAYLLGNGEPSTGFGIGVTNANAFKWNWAWTSGQPVGYVSLRLPTTTISGQPGAVFASPQPMLVKAGSSSSGFSWGQILAPSCGLTNTVVFPTTVPLATKNPMQLMGIDFCFESDDQTGCPTKVYSCDDFNNYPNPCECPPVQQLVWDKKSLLDVGITPGKLRHAWTHHHPRCPMTFLTLEGSCSQQGLYSNGSAGVSGIYSSIEGYVYGPNGSTQPLAGVYMKACTNGVPPCNDYTFTTNSSGKYKICIPSLNSCSSTRWNGTVTVKVPLPSGVTYTFPTHTYTNFCGTRATTAENFTATP